MNRKSFHMSGIIALVLLCAATVYGQGGSKIAIINFQEAVTATQEGQKVGRDLAAKYKPAQDRIQSKRQEVEVLKDQLRKGANTMSQDAQAKLARDIQTQERRLQRELEDAQADFNQEQQQRLGEIYQKMVAIVDKHAQDNGYTVVLDISGPQSPVLYAVNEANITANVVGVYDAENPATAAAAAPAAAAPAPSTPAAASTPAAGNTP
jgi:outer membrane protein